MTKAHPYILVAEDDADDRLLLQSAFADHGYNIELKFADDGIVLLDMLHSAKDTGMHMPGIIIMDLNMPRKDGRETLRDLKAGSEFADIPVIIFSTTDNKHEINKCMELGAEDYYCKPDEYGTFLLKISEIYDRWLVNYALELR